MMNIPRRLLLLGAALAMGWQIAAPRAANLGWLRTQDPARRLKQLSVDPMGAARVGAIYLKEHPEEKDPALLTSLLLASLKLDPSSLNAASDADLREMLRARLRADFSERKTVVVEGWILSRTEARLCALWG